MAEVAATPAPPQTGAGPARKAFIACAHPPGALEGGAALLSPLLRDRGGFDVRLAGGASAAARAEIISGLEWLAAGAAPGDTLFFIYEGPGQDPPVSSPLRDIEGYVQRLVPGDAASVGHIDHDLVYRTLIAPLPEGVRVLLVSDICHDGSLLDLKHVIGVQALRQRGAPALPAAVNDREYDNREWDVAIHLRRRGVYREPRADVVAIAPGNIDGRAFCDAGISAVACSARAVLRACESGADAFNTAPLVSLCKHATAEFRLMGGSPEGCLLVSTTGRPLTSLICSLA
jgi:hypothetical protein